ncbi:MAG: FKBP-type peptidyl-prolyl cis-trans isomerase [Gemmatimonadota bacterium]|nr:FKBP-type peptidyl-prolyl cis-trans isomerase [Gemmatimonadota bacterium]
MSTPSTYFRRARIRCAFVLFAAFASACGSDTETASDPATQTFAASLGVNIATMQKKADGLYYQDIVTGTGAEAIAGRTITVTYTGWQTDGQQFDTNVGGTPLTVSPLGTAGVIAGWNLGLQGMKVGGKRRLVIGSGLAYGAAGNGPIGKNKTLVFDVVLLTVQ